MKPLSPRAQRLTRAYRDENAVPHDVRARLLARLAQQADGDGDVSQTLRSVTAPRAARRWLRVLRWGGPVTLSLAALALFPRATSPVPAASTAPSQVAISARASGLAAPSEQRAAVRAPIPAPAARAMSATSRPRAKERRNTSSSNAEALAVRAQNSEQSAQDPLAEIVPEQLEQPRAQVTSSSSDPPPRASASADTTRPAAREEPVRAVAPEPQLSLDDEVMLVRRASDLLRSGDPLRALSALAEHARLFPNGKLVTMRRAARVQALCALGKRAEARAEAARFLADHGDSPYAAKVRELCAAP